MHKSNKLAMIKIKKYSKIFQRVHFFTKQIKTSKKKKKKIAKICIFSNSIYN